jgi:nuclear transport factor 2 (NTF2) superfamily protein
MKLDLSVEETRQPLPNFTVATAIEKIRKAEDAWNTKQPEVVATAYSLDTKWRNRDTFIQGRTEIITLLTEKWQREMHYKLIKELWSMHENRIAVRFAYEWRNEAGQWFRSYGNENWQFNDKGLMEQRHASINDVKIEESERKFLWASDKRPVDYPSLTELGL